MSNVNDPRELRLHFKGPGARDHAVPAEALVNSIRQVQRIVHLLAKQKRKEPVGARFRISRDIKERFGLACKLPVAGGYDLPVVIGGLPQPNADDEVLAVATQFCQVSRSLGRDGNAFKALVPEPGYRRLLLDAYEGAQPPKALGLDLTIEDGQGGAILERGHIDEARHDLDYLATESRIECGYVAGMLVQMEFDKRTITLKHHSRRTLKAVYAAESEATLLDHPRGLIQVHGEVHYNEAGDPVSIADVDEVVEVDESPMEVREFFHRNVRYRADPPLCFDVTFDQADDLYDLQGHFGISIWAESRDDLKDALDAELDLLLVDYAQGDPAHMSSDARKLRDEVRRRFGL